MPASGHSVPPTTSPLKLVYPLEEWDRRNSLSSLFLNSICGHKNTVAHLGRPGANLWGLVPPF